MNVIERPEFRDEIERLKRKYRHIENDLKDFYEGFLPSPLVRAFAIPGFERQLWKVRMKSSDQKRGKSGGFRLIFYFDENSPGAVHMLTIYPKAEREDIPPGELLQLLKKVMSDLQ